MHLLRATVRASRQLNDPAGGSADEVRVGVRGVLEKCGLRRPSFALSAETSQAEFEPESR
jgi:hypothetical protein